MKNNENQLLQHPYQPNIKLADFEGPLDLLLHLIRQSEMDVYDIPIAEITGQYMQYLRQMQRHQQPSECHAEQHQMHAGNGNQGNISSWRQL